MLCYLNLLDEGEERYMVEQRSLEDTKVVELCNVSIITHN